MLTVAFTPNLRRHLDCPEVEVAATTVAEALQKVFEQNSWKTLSSFLPPIYCVRFA